MGSGESSGAGSRQNGQKGEIMRFSELLKDLVRRLAVTLFGFVEILGLPRISEKENGEKGERP